MSKKEERLEPGEGCPGPHAEIVGSRFGPKIERLFMELREAVSLLLNFRGHGGKAALLLEITQSLVWFQASR